MGMAPTVGIGELHLFQVVAQLALTVLITIALLSFHRVYKHRYLLHWGLSWSAHGFFLLFASGSAMVAGGPSGAGVPGSLPVGSVHDCRLSSDCLAAPGYVGACRPPGCVSSDLSSGCGGRASGQRGVVDRARRGAGIWQSPGHWLGWASGGFWLASPISPLLWVWCGPLGGDRQPLVAT